MSLNQIPLNDQLLAQLFTSVLIESDATIVPVKRELKYLGSNGKNILIITDNDSFPYLPDNELQFLTTVLSACRLSLADVAIVNLHNVPDATEITEVVPCSTVLLFGVAPLAIGLPIHFPHFQLQQFNKKNYLCAPPLAEIENDKHLKMNLWNNLKKLFGI